MRNERDGGNQSARQRTRRPYMTARSIEWPRGTRVITISQLYKAPTTRNLAAESAHSFAGRRNARAVVARCYPAGIEHGCRKPDGSHVTHRTR